MKKLISIMLASGILYAIYKGWNYYSDNALYAHYIAKSYWKGLKGKIDNGYTDKTSYFPGERQKIYIDAKKEGVAVLKLFDINGKVVDSLKVAVAPQETGENPSENGFGYKVTFQYEIPDLKSGLYLWEQCIPFIVKGTKEEIVVLYPANTINAYNIAGGKSLYSIFSKQTNVVSFLRPTFPPVSFQVNAGLQYLSTLNSLPIRYISDQDMENYASIDDAELLIIIGHSEYWTRKAREHFDQFVEAGGDALILSGNTMWWQVRYQNNGERMVCYKLLEDTVSDKRLATSNWTEEQLNYPLIPSIGVDFQHGGFGRKYDKSYKGLKIVNASSPILAGTSLENGDIIHIPTKEYDGTLLRKVHNDWVLDTAKLNFYKAELIAYDKALLQDEGFATFIIFQKNKNSGVVINASTMDWCSGYGLGGKDSLLLKTITYNMINGLWEDKNLFTY